MATPQILPSFETISKVTNLSTDKCVHAQSLRLCLTPGSSVMAFSRQEYWSGLPCPPPGDLPDPGIELGFPANPVLQADSLPLSHQGSPLINV